MEKLVLWSVGAIIICLGAILPRGDERVEGEAEWAVMQAHDQVVFQLKEDERWFTFQHGTFCHERARPTCEDLGYDSYTNVKAGKRVIFRVGESDGFLVPITSPALMQRF